ncbi:MAG TPA: hypothetical protein VK194_06150, partial [Candidatus Deferrimicrobium sp.]|nr:hypothetical protein [Candidatus Deferrimicrobium sp.]
MPPDTIVEGSQIVGCAARGVVGPADERGVVDPGESGLADVGRADEAGGGLVHADEARRAGAAG